VSAVPWWVWAVLVALVVWGAVDHRVVTGRRLHTPVGEPAEDQNTTGQKVPAVWGVEFSASQSPDHVTVSADEAAARRFLRGLEFCGNADARLVVDEGNGWHPADTAGEVPA
jgi:hypothetical protein